MSNEDKTPGYMRLSVIQSCAVDDIYITDALLRVLVALGSYASEQNSDLLWAGQDKIAKRMGVSRQSVGKRTRELERLGYVEIDPRYRDDGGRASNWVRLKMDFQLPQERRRTGRLKAGLGGRPRVVTVLDTDTPPETPRSFRGMKLPEVSGVKLPEVSGPETSKKFQQNLEEESGNETGKKKSRARGSSSPKKKIAEATPETLPPSPPSPIERQKYEEWTPGDLEPARLWGRVVATLQATTPAAQMASWIYPARLVRYGWDADKTLCVELVTPGHAHARMIEDRYGYLIADAVARVYSLPASRVALSIVASSALLEVNA